jgi:hypothetical protein
LEGLGVEPVAENRIARSGQRENVKNIAKQKGCEKEDNDYHG